MSASYEHAVAGLRAARALLSKVAGVELLDPLLEGNVILRSTAGIHLALSYLLNNPPPKRKSRKPATTRKRRTRK